MILMLTRLVRCLARPCPALPISWHFSYYSWLQLFLLLGIQSQLLYNKIPHHFLLNIFRLSVAHNSFKWRFLVSFLFLFLPFFSSYFLNQTTVDDDSTVWLLYNYEDRLLFLLFLSCLIIFWIKRTIICAFHVILSRLSLSAQSIAMHCEASTSFINEQPSKKTAQSSTLLFFIVCLTPIIAPDWAHPPDYL